MGSEMCIRDRSNYSDTGLDLKEIAKKIQDRYVGNVLLDWPNTPSGRANISVSFKRVLGVFNYPETSREEIVDQMVEHYANSYFDKVVDEL